MKREFTATAYVIDGDKTLLVYHRKMQKWLPPGGHIDPGELPTEAAIREAKEETGIDIELIDDTALLIDQPNAVSIPRPYLCLVEEIPPHGDEEAHQHIDMVYLARPVGGTLQHNARESDGVRWVTLEEAEKMTLYEESLQTLRLLLA